MEKKNNILYEVGYTNSILKKVMEVVLCRFCMLMHLKWEVQI